ncbi:hypothetical protein MCUN1_003125 [Malassezia cuniculi]|uniref:Lysophospholipase NTE1 n=1 Tax=Malassezia cuniculi TaxID=948313 RepID=A0AAF0F0V6_9BASI|nr:hypothetical protein MCUN1_003125 [Malassezia cuniculi]
MDQELVLPSPAQALIQAEVQSPTPPRQLIDVIAFFTVASSLVLLFMLRYRYWNSYERLREEPIRKQEDAIHLFPENPAEAADEFRSFHGYLDEFLQAIRIFGFLERPVFHELARHLQTRRLVAGDSLAVDMDTSFYIVIDGNVEVYAPSATNAVEDSEYQLVNEVSSGGVLSSLFTILRLFTEDVQLGFSVPQNSVPDADVPPLKEMQPSVLRRRTKTAPVGPVAPGHVLPLQSPISVPIDDDTLSEPIPMSTSMQMDNASSPFLGASPSVSSRASVFGSPYSKSERATLQHGSLARATVDTTLAVIPAGAFKRLTAKFPNAAAHIVQVILTRLARVTFHTAHQYLGLTSDVMKTEEAINKYAKVFLPSEFYENKAIEQLRRRFRPELASLDTKPTKMDDENTGRHAVSPGDLLSMVSSSTTFDVNDEPVHRGSYQQPMAEQRDAELRDEVMSCIASSIGLNPAVIGTTPSAHASPFLSSSDALNRGAYASAFSSLSRLDASTVTSEESMAASMSAIPPPLAPTDNGVVLRYYAAGTTLARAGDTGAGLFYVIDGFLDIMLPNDGKEEKARPKPPPRRSRVPSTSKVGNALDGTSGRQPSTLHPIRESDELLMAHAAAGRQQEEDRARFLYSVGRGGIAGYLSSLLDVPSYVDIVAKTDVYVGVLPVDALERLVEKRPNALLTLSKRLLSLLPPLILHIDAALDWQQLNAGQLLFKEGDPGDNLYIVINGRLRAVSGRGEDGAPVEVLGEYGQGDCVGELDVISRTPRSKTVHAIRDTELVCMPITLFNAISLWHPPVTVQVSRIIARRVRRELESIQQASRVAQTQHIHGISSLGRSALNLKTVALLPASPHVPITEFAARLRSACEDTIDGEAAFLNHGSVMQALGRHVFSRMGKLKLAGWLATLELRYRLVVYVADTSASSAWAQTCVRQADCILLVGNGDDPSISDYERLLLSIKTTARKELVLLHSERTVTPGSTREWLKLRPWVSAHHHVEMPQMREPQAPVQPRDRLPVQALRTLKEQLEIRMRRGRNRAPTTRPAHFSDFSRLARRLCGISIGVVLGGGGARGCAHLGVLRVLEERGIPVDIVGGTSIGSLVAGLYARDGSVVSSLGRAKRFAGRMASLWRFVTDLTYPLVSYTTGHEFNRSVFKVFSDTHIEDMWLPYFCNTTNITLSRMEVHTSGYAWRYVRGSMTLAGLIPPLIDNGNMLVDGGYTDNLPVTTMFAMGARTVFAIDVGSIDDTSPQHFGDTLSGWWVLLARLNPWSSLRNVPSVPDIQRRLSYTTSVRMLEDTKALDGCFYMRMPVEMYGTLEFSRFDEIFHP